MRNNTFLCHESEKFVYFSGVAGWSRVQQDEMSGEIVYNVLIDRSEYHCSGSNETSDAFCYSFLKHCKRLQALSFLLFWMDRFKLRMAILFRCHS